MMMRTYAMRADGDGYGRHALGTPGGNGVQFDVLHMVAPSQRRTPIHPTRYNDAYVARHRQTVDSTRWMQSDGTLARWSHGQIEVVA